MKPFHVILTAASLATSVDAAAAQVRTGPVYFEYQVERSAKLDSTTLHLVYPEMLKSAKFEGTVIGQFTVDTAGRPEPTTLKIIKSTHDLFTNSVRHALPALRFTPALYQGHAVQQYVQMPFEFRLPQHH